MSYNYPTEAAWSLLKQEEGEQPELSRDDQMAISAFYEQLDPDSKRRIEVIQHAMSQLSPEKHASLTRGMHDELAPHIGNLSQTLQQAHGQSISDNSKTFDKGDKSLAMVYEGRIAKILPLAVYIGATFAMDAIARSQGARSSPIANVLKEGYNAVVPEKDEWPIDWGYDNEARIIDPVLGMEHDTVFGHDTNWEDPTMGQRALAGGVGALSYLNPIGLAAKYGTKVGRAAGAGHRARQGAKAARLTERGGAAGAAGKSQTGYLSPTRRGERLQTRVTAANERAAANAPRWDKAVLAGRAVGRAGQVLGPTLAGAGAAAAMHNLSNNTPTMPNTTGSQTGFNMGPSGQGANIHGNQTARKEIWNPTGSQFTQQQEWGGPGQGAMAQKGEYMRLGDKILKETQDMMYKTVCPACGKKNCTCKEYKNKKDDSKKKPAHGVVIVIGTKAGPGPSTDGKRDKLDSDKSE